MNQFEPPQQTPLGEQPSHGLAIASLVLAFLFSPVGIILAIIAKKNGNTGGLATAGLIVGIVGTVLVFLPMLVVCGGCACVCLGCGTCGPCAEFIDELMWELGL
jgi:hypothetical protein